MSQQRKTQRTQTKSELIEDNNALKTELLQLYNAFTNLEREYVAYRSVLALALVEKEFEWTISEDAYAQLQGQYHITFSPVEDDETSIVVRLEEVTEEFVEAELVEEAADEEE